MGVQWLQQLETVAHDYANPSMEFNWLGKKIKLQGDQSLTPQKITFNQLQVLLEKNEVQGLFELVQLPPKEIGEKCTSSENTHIPQDVPPELASILRQYEQLFKTPKGLPPRRGNTQRIYLAPGTKPVNVRPYRYPHFQKEEIERLVREMLDQGIIRASTSPFSSPVLLVRKRDSSYRFCVDYRALNKATIRDNFPIPTAYELFNEMENAKVFTKLDLRAGYHQIRVHDRDIYKTAFRTHEGHYEFLVMPFGLTNAPSTFQAAMNKMFSPFLRKFVLVFFDDILIYSPSMTSHAEHLQQVLQTLQNNVFFVKMSKCSFGKPTIEYLGHIID